MIINRPVDEEEEKVEEEEVEDSKDVKIRTGIRMVRVRIRMGIRIGMIVMMSLRRRYRARQETPGWRLFSPW